MTMMRTLATAALLLGCSGSGNLESAARVDAAVRGGALAPDDTSVVAVVNFSGGHCSGSLIAPRLVLTARHCVADTAGQEVKVVCGETKFDPPDSAGAIFVVPQPTITDDPDDYRSVARIVLPEDSGDDLCGSDEALLVLDEPLSELSPLVPRLEPPVSAGEGYSSVGFGIDDALEGRPSGTRKRLDDLQVTCASDDCRSTDVRENEWVGSGGPCSGDSGGPALDKDGRVIGVVSRGKDHCTEPVFGDVSSRADWLIGQASAVADDVEEERPSWAPCSDAHPCPAAAEAELASSCSVSARPDEHTTWPLALLLLASCTKRRKSTSRRRAAGVRH